MTSFKEKISDLGNHVYCLGGKIKDIGDGISSLSVLGCESREPYIRQSKIIDMVKSLEALKYVEEDLQKYEKDLIDLIKEN